ncbi:hypothetical protein ElyMa_006879700 [Elysia marginata]|uniref:Uncharacterized protein n=1 Tax=Elysia marginata TaxID=1093978 RepID=A0AAV4JD29_9GAST|nr:hypothetical protein ElyMa_006879700 [Elysia marginata]
MADGLTEPISQSSALQQQQRFYHHSNSCNAFTIINNSTAATLLPSSITAQQQKQQHIYHSNNDSNMKRKSTSIKNNVLNWKITTIPPTKHRTIGRQDKPQEMAKLSSSLPVDLGFYQVQARYPP